MSSVFIDFGVKISHGRVSASLGPSQVLFVSEYINDIL